MIINSTVAKQKWCHEAMYFKYADQKDRCETCRGDKNRPLGNADLYCSACRLACGPNNCNHGEGPCCVFCEEFEVGY